MLAKPKSCLGCPLYGTGRGFVPDVLRPGAPVMVYGQNPSEEDEVQGQPMTGKAGDIMESTYLKLAGLCREEVSIGNAIRCRWKFGSELPPLEQNIAKQALEHCYQAYHQIPEGTKLIVSQGEHALYTLTGETSEYEWRGWALPLQSTPAGQARLHQATLWVPDHSDIPVLGTLSLATLYGDSSMVLATQRDWGKVPHILKGLWPKACPPVDVLPPAIWPAKAAFDTEFDTETKELYHYSLAYRVEGKPRIHSVPITNHSPITVPDLSLTVITQNAWADLQHLWRVMGLLPSFKLHPSITVEDTMLEHSVLYPDQPHDLDFLGSIYSSMNRWKHLREVPGQLTEYAGADAWGTLEVQERGMDPDFKWDPLSLGVYHKYVRPLISLIENGSQSRGVRTHRERVATAAEVMSRRMHKATAEAEAIAGWAINLGSNPQVGHMLFEVLGFPEGIRRRK